MNENERDNLPLREESNEKMDFAELEKKLNSQLENEISDLKTLQDDFQKIGNPVALGDAIKDVIWNQFLIQIGYKQGEAFIEENRGLKLDLRKSAHTQTTENFEKGKIASHNPYFDYQKNYNKWQSNLIKDKDGNVKKEWDSINEEMVIKVHKNARKPFDKDREDKRLIGSASVAKDHQVPLDEILRDSETNAHLSESEQIQFANSPDNLYDLRSAANSSKKNHNGEKWIERKRPDGQSQDEYFGIDKEIFLKQERTARDAYKKVKQQGEQRSIETGKKSRKEEAFRIGKSAVRTVVFALLADLIKTIIKKLIAWLLSAKKNLDSLLESLKNAIKEFVTNLKNRLINVGTSLVTTIMMAIFKPAANLIKNVWVLLKQGYKSIKDAVTYLKDPQNKEFPFSIKLMQVGKIVTAGLTAGGAILLGEVIEKGLMTIPVFTVQIPLLGSLANILGIFFGALVSGIVGAIALNLIDKAISNKQKQINQEKQTEKKNEIMRTQSGLIAVSSAALAAEKNNLDTSIKDRHESASEEMNKSIEKINQNAADIKSNSANDNASVIDELNNLLDNL